MNQNIINENFLKSQFYIQTVPKSYIEILTDLEGYVLPYNNFAKYRQALKQAGYPCLPFIAVYCRDLTHIEEGNPDLLDNGHVNLEKMRMKTAILKQIVDYQNHPYSFPVNLTIQNYLSNISALSEANIKQRSFQIEPRNDI